MIDQKSEAISLNIRAPARAIDWIDVVVKNLTQNSVQLLNKVPYTGAENLVSRVV